MQPVVTGGLQAVASPRCPQGIPPPPFKCYPGRLGNPATMLEAKRVTIAREEVNGQGETTQNSPRDDRARSTESVM